MVIIKPYGLTRTQKLGDEYLAVMMNEIHDVLKIAASRLDKHDVIQSSHMIKILWLNNAVDRLMAELHNVVHESALDVRNQLQRLVNKQVITAAIGDDIVPPVEGAFAIPDLPDLLGEIYLNTRRNYLVNVGNEVWDVVRTQLLEGMHAGEGIAELKDRVTASAGFSEARAERVARTEVVGASNAGAFGQMQASGMESTKTWLATSGDRTRPTHREANGQTVDLNAKFMVGGYPMDRPHDSNAPADEIINCVVGSTIVDAPLIKKAMRSWYEGDVIHIVTASKTLTVTPNHPILTTRGWVDAKSLIPGDDVVCGDVGKIRRFNHYINRGPTEITQIFNATSIFGGAHGIRKEVADFHGERRETEINVVSEDRKLGFEIEAAREQEVKQFAFTLANVARATKGCGLSGLFTLPGTGRFTDIGFTTNRIGFTSKNTTFTDSEILHAKVISFAARTQLDSMTAKKIRNQGTGSAISFAERENGFTLNITTDNVIRADRQFFRGQVYNLETTGGWYTSNSIITHNCRCTLTFEIADDEVIDSLLATGDEFAQSRDWHGRFGKGGGVHIASDKEYKATFEQAQAKIANAPVPSAAAVTKARAELDRGNAGIGRAGGDSRGGSAASRRKQRENLFKEFGGDKKGYVVCHGCGLKTHHSDKPELNPKQYAKFERGKIFIKAQGGGYQLPNLLPECFGCNRSRNDQMLRPENAP